MRIVGDRLSAREEDRRRTQHCICRYHASLFMCRLETSWNFLRQNMSRRHAYTRSNAFSRTWRDHETIVPVSLPLRHKQDRSFVSKFHQRYPNDYSCKSYNQRTGIANNGNILHERKLRSNLNDLGKKEILFSFKYYQLVFFFFLLYL